MERYILTKDVVMTSGNRGGGNPTIKHLARKGETVWYNCFPCGDGGKKHVITKMINNVRFEASKVTRG